MSTPSLPPTCPAGRAKSPSAPGHPQRHLQAGTGRLAQPPPCPVPLGMELPHLPVPMDGSCCQAGVPQVPPCLLGLEQPEHFVSWQPFSSRRGPGVDFFISPIIKQLLQHLGRRRKPRAGYWEALGTVGAARASAPGGLLHQGDVRMSQGNSSTGAQTDPWPLAPGPVPTPSAPAGTTRLGWGGQGCPSSWVGRDEWLGVFWTWRGWQGWSWAAVGCPTALPSPLPAVIPASLFSPPSCGRHQQAPGAAAQPGGRVPHHPLREGERAVGHGDGACG